MTPPAQTIATIDQTLAEVMAADPSAARVLEAFGLDYCCGGSRALVQACDEAGVDPDLVVAALSEHVPEPTPAWATLPPGLLADHIEATHHAYLHAELPRLHALAEKVADVHGVRHHELHDVLHSYAELRSELQPHLAKEERVVFPTIRQLAAAPAPGPIPHTSIREPISVLLSDHDRAGELLERLRSLTGGFEVPDDGCASYRALYDGLAQLEADTHLHVHKENNVLFPAALALDASS